MVIITSGSPRKPGMSRADLEKINSEIVSSICKSLKKSTPTATFLIVTNPVEKMTAVAFKTLRVNREKVFGLSGVLDSARYEYFLQEKFATDQVAGMVAGPHNDNMIPLVSQTSIEGNDAQGQDLGAVIEKTKKGGAQIVELLGTSAYFAPAASIYRMVEAVLLDTKEILPTVILAKGEYGIKNSFIGLPTKLGKEGAEEIVELDLASGEIEQLRKSSR
jgi:malate dehydrogenase